jgi:hypothetical protein
MRPIFFSGGGAPGQAHPSAAISRACWPWLCSGVSLCHVATPDHLLRSAPCSPFPYRRDGRPSAAEEQIITVYKDPSCDCCSGWVQHLQHAGFTVKTIETSDLKPVKTRLGVPNDLAACHTAQIGGYVIEGHVPAAALKRFLNDQPSAIGLAVPGMPVGSPGMEGGTAEPYDVVMFGPGGRRTYMRFVGDRAL